MKRILTTIIALTVALALGGTLHAEYNEIGTPFQMTGSTDFIAGAGVTNVYTGLISGTGPAVVKGGGTVAFSHPNNTYTGGTRVEDAVFRLDADGRAATTLAEDYVLMQPEPGCSAKPFLRDEKGGVVALCNEKGDGRVVTVAAPRMLPAEWLDAGRGEYKARLGGIISGAKRFSLVRFLLERVQDETMPVDVEGNVQWGVNKTKDGWLVWLMNADGVEKFRGDIGSGSTFRGRPWSTCG